MLGNLISVLVLFVGINSKKEFEIVFDKIVYQDYLIVEQDGATNGYIQLIFYDYSPDFQVYHVQDYRLLDEAYYKAHYINNIYYRDGPYHCFKMYDHTLNDYLVFKTKIFEHTHIRNPDLETVNKKIFKEELRYKINERIKHETNKRKP